LNFRPRGSICIFKEDCGLCVGVGDAIASVSLGSSHDLLRGELLGPQRPPFPRSLGDVGVLTESAAEITAHGGYGEASRAREKIIQRLLLDRIHVDGNGLGVDQGVQSAIYVLSHSAYPKPIWLYGAAMGTQSTSHQPVIQFLI